MTQSGIKYFKYDKNLYNGDETKYCSLNGGEIDNNFYFLRGMDIVGGYFDENAKLHLLTLADDDIEISGNTFSVSGESIDFSGTTYDGENGILDIWVNGENVASLSGFTVCNCEALMNKISGLTECLDSTNATVDSLAKSLDDFQKSLDDIAIDGSINNENVIKRLLSIDTATKDNKTNIAINTNNISKLQEGTKTIADSLEERKKEINVLSASIEKEASERKASDEEINGKINSLETSLNEKIEENSQNIASIRQEFTAHSESNEKEFEEIHNLIDTNKVSVTNIKKLLDNEIERATTAETELSDNIESVKTEINTNVKERLDHQQQDIDNINANVNETLSFATSALTEVSKHTISGISLDEDDNLKLIFKDPNHFMETSLKKYNCLPDKETLDKSGQTFSVITDKDGGVVSCKAFNKHVQEYNDLLSKYNALLDEINNIKNKIVCYAATFYEGYYEDDSILQKKYEVDIFNKEFIFEKDLGDRILFAVPNDCEVEKAATEDSDLLDQFTKTQTKRLDGKPYDIYTLEAGEPSSHGTQFKVKLK